MSNSAKKEFIDEMRLLYHGATKVQKQGILDNVCAVCGYNRKYATRLLNQVRKTRPKKKSGRKKYYHDPELIEVLMDLWVTTNLPCAKRLKYIIPLWLPFYDKFIVPEEVRQKLLKISPATIDRLMAKTRHKYKKRGLATTKPGSVIKNQIPIKTSQWDETVPGFIEADTVAHCGNSTAGQFVYTVNCVDIASGWTEQRAVWGKGERGVLEAIRNIENSVPFPIKGFDCDNGSEFLNWHLIRYLTHRKNPVHFTRARAYHKNDNAHIENKNWTHVRQNLGYQRFEHQDITEKLNELYTTEWNQYFNFFIPSVKLMKKTRVGSKIIKTYDQPKTPVQRLLESEHIAQNTKQRLTQTLAQLNPFQIQKHMKHKIIQILKDVNNNA